MYIYLKVNFGRIMIVFEKKLIIEIVKFWHKQHIFKFKNHLIYTEKYITNKKETPAYSNNLPKLTQFFSK